MQPEQFLLQLKQKPETLAFKDVIAFVDSNYHYSPQRFSNGLGDDPVINEAGKNEGSCKIFALGLDLELNESETLACFGEYYRDEVLQHPQHTDHANIRRFMRDGWAGIRFDGRALEARAPGQEVS